jgi:uncharacterized protein (DUF1697 family)
VSRTFAFLRAINVGGHVVTMAALRAHFEALGLTGVETFIASGNVIFTTPARVPATLPQRIEARLHHALGYEVHTFLRSETEVAAIASHRPFSPGQIEAARAFSVGLLAEPLTAGGRKAAMALRTDIDDFHVHGREIYWLCRKGQSESTFNNNRFESVIQGRVTFRSMTTMTRLVARYVTT